MKGSRSNGPDFADDILRGADQIALALFGSVTHRRKVYHLVRTSRLPIFRIGSMLCLRRTRLSDWIQQQEDDSLRG